MEYQKGFRGLIGLFIDLPKSACEVLSSVGQYLSPMHSQNTYILCLRSDGTRLTFGRTNRSFLSRQIQAPTVWLIDVLTWAKPSSSILVASYNAWS